MSTTWESPIMRVTTGKINTVNDTVVGGVEKIPGVTGLPRYGGMLGKHLWVSPDSIENMHDPTVGDLYGGRYTYVRMRLADVVPVVGQIVFWDTTVATWQRAYQVTTEADRSSVGPGLMMAGIVLGTVTLGNYFFIQDLGMADVMSEAGFAGVAAIGSRMECGNQVAPTDEGRMDVIDDIAAVATTLVSGRFLGLAVELPVVDTITQVLLDFHNALAVTP